MHLIKLSDVPHIQNAWLEDSLSKIVLREICSGNFTVMGFYGITQHAVSMAALF